MEAALYLRRCCQQSFSISAMIACVKTAEHSDLRCAILQHCSAAMAQLNPVSDMLTILSDSQELQLICLIVAGLKSYGVYSMPELAQQPVLQHSLGENVGLCIHSARCPV